MRVLDPINAPSGREQFTNRPAWRVRLAPDQVQWAFVETSEDGRVWITGYPIHPVESAHPAPDPIAGLVVGAGAGTLLGGALGGSSGALLGGLIGALFGAGGGTATRT